MKLARLSSTLTLGQLDIYDSEKIIIARYSLVKLGVALCNFVQLSAVKLDAARGAARYGSVRLVAARRSFEQLGTTQYTSV